MPFIASTGGALGYGRAKQAASAPPSGTYRVLIVGDSSVSAIPTPLQTAKTALGYSSVTLTITTVAVSGSYNGTDITTANYEAIMVYTNGGITYNATVGTNIASFAAAGGVVITMVFCWSIRIANYPFTTTPLNYNQGGTTQQQNGTNGNRTDSVVHPITTGITTSTTGGVATFYQDFLGVSDGNSTIISTFTSNSLPMIAVRTGATGIRSVSINLFGLYASSNTPIAQLVVRSILWGVKYIN